MLYKVTICLYRQIERAYGGETILLFKIYLFPPLELLSIAQEKKGPIKRLAFIHGPNRSVSMNSQNKGLKKVKFTITLFVLENILFSNLYIIKFNFYF